MSCPLAAERVWVDKSRYHEAEKAYFERLAKLLKENTENNHGEIVCNEEECGTKSAGEKFEEIEMKSNQPQINVDIEIGKQAVVKIAPELGIKTKKKKNKKNKQIHNNINETADIDKDKQDLPTELPSADNSVSEEIKQKKSKKKKNSHNKEEGIVVDLKMENTKEKDTRNEKMLAYKEKHEQINNISSIIDTGGDAIKNSREISPEKLSTDNSVSEEISKKPKKKKKSHNKEEKGTLEILKRENSKANEQPTDKTVTNKINVIDLNKKIEENFEKIDETKAENDQGSDKCTLVSEIAKARQHIKNSLEKMDGIAAMAAYSGEEVCERLNNLEKENANLHSMVDQLKKNLSDSYSRIEALENQIKALAISKPAAKPEAQSKPDEDDDGVDLFASDSEDEDEGAAKIREQRLAEYNAKKSTKKPIIAKSSVILDVKPWDDETDLAVVEAGIRKIEMDGLLWGAAKLVPVAFGIKKLSINCVVEDEKVSIDLLTEEIEKLEEFVQSVDVAAFNKI